MTTSHSFHWRDLLENPAAIASVFGEADPDLSAVRLHGIDVAEGGSFLTVKFSVRRELDRLPNRWGSKVDEISIELQCLALVEASMSIRSGDSTVRCEFTNDSVSGRALRIRGATDVSIRCGFVRVNHIVPYVADYSPEAM